MATLLAKPDLYRRHGSGSEEATNWSGALARTAIEEWRIDAGQPTIRRSQRLVSIVIIAFYVVCAVAVFGAPTAPDLDILALTSP